MPKLIEIVDAEYLPAYITLNTGDLLQLGASGGHIISGEGIIELLGAFTQSFMQDNNIASPAGPPGILLLLAREPGKAQLNIITGDPWSKPVTNRIEITVLPV
ncbi:MAG: hypothetical protein WCF67_16915 [Chitinophagaceae bacterium]